MTQDIKRGPVVLQSELARITENSKLVSLCVGELVYDFVEELAVPSLAS